MPGNWDLDRRASDVGESPDLGARNDSGGSRAARGGTRIRVCAGGDADGAGEAADCDATALDGPIRRSLFVRVSGVAAGGFVFL